MAVPNYDQKRGARRINTSRAGGQRPPQAKAALFDQQTAPLPPQKKRGGGMQQTVLPLGRAPGVPPDAAPCRRKGPPSQAAAQRRVSRGEMRRRRRNRRWLAVFFVLLLMAVGAVLSVTVLFKVKHFVVENLDKSTPANTGIYTEEAILGALAVPLEENLFQFSASQRQAAMELQLPYLETIRVRRRLPDTVVVQVEPAVESWCVKHGESWLILSKGLKVLKIEPQQPVNLPLITGLGVQSPVVGGRLQLTTALQAQQLADLLAQLDSQQLTADCARIDMGGGDNAYVVYQGRIKVQLGTFNNLEYKLGVAAKLLRNESGEYLGATDRGVLDVSSQLEGSVHRFPFSPGDFTTEESEPPAPDTAASASGASGSQSGAASASQPAQSGSEAQPASGAASGSAAQPAA